MSVNAKQELLEAIKQWSIVANSSDLMYCKGTRDSASRTVKALQYELETGVPVCSCCFKPLSGEAKDNH